MTDSRAFTTVELLLLVSITLVAASVWPVAVSSVRVGHEAQSLSRTVSLTRAAAILTGRASACVAPSSHGVLTIVGPARGLLFTPDGLPRTCDGGGVGNTTILLEHRGRQAAVIVSSLGRVRWELR